MSTWITNSTIGSLPKILDYDIAFGDSAGELAEEVAALIEKGWQPYGSPYGFVDAKGSEWHHQAMVTYER